jgi:hypothetical protein
MTSRSEKRPSLAELEALCRGLREATQRVIQPGVTVVFIAYPSEADATGGRFLSFGLAGDHDADVAAGVIYEWAERIVQRQS